MNSVMPLISACDSRSSYPLSRQDSAFGAATAPGTMPFFNISASSFSRWVAKSIFSVASGDRLNTRSSHSFRSSGSSSLR